MEFAFQSLSTADTWKLGKSLTTGLLATLEKARLVICLDGPLGSGKTLFTRAFCEAMGVDANHISSPTFSLQNVYQGQVGSRSISINHFDFYRLDDEDELFEIGFEETITQRGIHILEWSQKFPMVLPPDRLQITISPGSGDARHFQFKDCGEFPWEALKSLQTVCDPRSVSP